MKDVYIDISPEEIQDLIKGVIDSNDCDYICNYYTCCDECPFSFQNADVEGCSEILGNFYSKGSVKRAIDNLFIIGLRAKEVRKIKRNDDNGKNKR